MENIDNDICVWSFDLLPENAFLPPLKAAEILLEKHWICVDPSQSFLEHQVQWTPSFRTSHELESCDWECVERT